MIRILFIVAVLILLVGFLVWFITGEMELPTANTPAEGRISIQGEMVCLPHRDTSGPQTLECAYGLLGSDGNHYGLRDQVAPSSENVITNVPTGAEVTVEGEFSRETDEKYATVGFIEVSSITTAEGTQNTEEVTHSDGVITFTVPEDFGLAVTDEQILVDSVIPPCDSDFEYCLYYNGTAYADTNFLSAGLRIDKRADLDDLDSCLTTQPEGYTSLEAAISTASTSSFAPLRDAAAGSYSTGEEYRLYASSTCYQFTTRVGASQFGNAEPGTVEFSEGEQESMLSTLRGIIENMTLFGGTERIELPQQ